LTVTETEREAEAGQCCYCESVTSSL